MARRGSCRLTNHWSSPHSAYQSSPSRANPATRSVHFNLSYEAISWYDLAWSRDVARFALSTEQRHDNDERRQQTSVWCQYTHLELHAGLPITFPSPLPPVGHIWDVMLVWRKGNINKNCLCVTVLSTIIMVHKDTSSSYRSVDSIRLWSCLV